MIVKCKNCSRNIETEKMDHYYTSGYYCSNKCWETLLRVCVNCGKQDLEVRSNDNCCDAPVCRECFFKLICNKLPPIKDWDRFRNKYDWSVYPYYFEYFIDKENKYRGRDFQAVTDSRRD